MAMVKLMYLLHDSIPVKQPAKIFKAATAPGYSWGLARAVFRQKTG